MSGKLWGIEELAEFLGVPVQTIYKWRAKKFGPPARRMGKYLKYDPDEVLAWWKSLPTEAA